MSKTAEELHDSPENAHAENVTVTPSNWVKPELITIKDEAIGGKILNGGESPANYQGPS